MHSTETASHAAALEEPVAGEAELRLGQLAVQRGLATEEQVLAALQARNRTPEGPDLGEHLVSLGVLPASIVASLRRAVAAGENPKPRERAEQSTDHEISLGSVREVIARDQLEAALARVAASPAETVRELERLAREFPDTESGVKAGAEARRLSRLP